MPRARRHALVFLVISLYCLLVLPRMLSYGMFMDGVVYASIARNMAENYGQLLATLLYCHGISNLL